MTVFGWDGSDFDFGRGPVNVEAMVADLGAPDCFVTFKAWEGSTIAHRQYGNVINRARGAGVRVLGAYFVPRTPGNGGHGPIAEQVAAFLRYLDAQTPWWRDYEGFFLQVDTEHWGTYDAVAPRYGVEACDRLASTGKLRIHYAPKWAYGDSIGGRDPLWASSYVTGEGHFRALYPGDGSSRWAAYSGRTPTILQYSSSAVIGGQPTCDANAYRGTFAQLWALVTEGKDDMALADDPDGKWLYPRVETLAHLMPAVTMGPEKGKPLELVAAIRDIQANAKAAAEKTVPVALSAEDRAAIVADLQPSIVEAVKQALREGAA